jgi:PadR family transcriptional regulator, regulatory protein PadR
MARRRPGRLFPLELDILECGLDLQARDGSFYGFALASALADRSASGLTAHGTLYKALGRMKDAGLLEASWEDVGTADVENRPRRRLYTVTAEGEAARSAERVALAAERASASPAPRPVGGAAHQSGVIS